MDIIKTAQDILKRFDGNIEYAVKATELVIENEKRMYDMRHDGSSGWSKSYEDSKESNFYALVLFHVKRGLTP